MTVFEELVDELKVDNLIDERAPERRIPSQRIDDEVKALDPEGFTRRQLRAEEDFSTIQLIEHLFDGVEGDPSKSDAAVLAASEARRALGRIRQLSHAEDLEFFRELSELSNALKEWRSELELRDTRIEASRLRAFCENSHPPLSAKSLIALAGLYNGESFSDNTRDKFDFVMTRLFTFEQSTVKREMRFGRGETIEQIQKLYDKWGFDHEGPSKDDPPVYEVVEKFAAFGRRIDAAPTFADLLRSDIPSGIREFKKSLDSLIFEPEILASLLECNVKIGNRFVEIAASEKESYGPEAVRSKYGDAYDQIATDVAARTLRLAELLESEDLVPEKESGPIEIKADEVSVTPSKQQRSRRGILRGVNKVLLAATILTVIAGIAAFFLIDTSNTARRSDTPAAKQIDISGTPFGRYFTDPKMTESTLYVISTLDWEGLTPEEKKKILKLALDDTKKRGRASVRVQSSEGKRIAYASDTRIELTE
jgi:hypothetical protein